MYYFTPTLIKKKKKHKHLIIQKGKHKIQNLILLVKNILKYDVYIYINKKYYIYNII